MENNFAAQLQGVRFSTDATQLTRAARFIELWGGAKTRSRDHVIACIKRSFTWSDELAADKLERFTERPVLYQNGTHHTTWFILRKKRNGRRYELVKGSLNGI